MGDLVGSGISLVAQLGPLANNGGPTLTCALLAGSPAIDAGDDALLSPPLSLTTDQRGFPRLSGLHPDIGAFEVQWASFPIRIAVFGGATNGAIQLMLTNIPGASLTLLAAPDPSLPLSAWAVLGPFPKSPPANSNSPTPHSQRSANGFTVPVAPSPSHA